jgi:hypothetical protein
VTAINLARGVTGREKIIKFSGGYHGYSDSLMVSGGSGLFTLNSPDSQALLLSLIRQTFSLPYNDPETLAEIFEKEGPEIAAVIVEPIVGNMGLLDDGAIAIDGQAQVNKTFNLKPERAMVVLLGYIPQGLFNLNAHTPQLLVKLIARQFL